VFVYIPLRILTYIYNTIRQRKWYCFRFEISLNLLFLYFAIFSLNCICGHLFSADNISVFTYNFIHVQFHFTVVSSRSLKSVNIWNWSPFWNALSREFRCRWRHLSCKLRPEILLMHLLLMYDGLSPYESCRLHARNTTLSKEALIYVPYLRYIII
jgi:hypothetical protein